MAPYVNVFNVFLLQNQKDVVVYIVVHNRKQMKYPIDKSKTYVFRGWGICLLVIKYQLYVLAFTCIAYIH